MSLERGPDYFIAVCNLCGERSNLIAFDDTIDVKLLQNDFYGSLSKHGWQLDSGADGALYCPTCAKAMERMLPGIFARPPQ